MFTLHRVAIGFLTCALAALASPGRAAEVDRYLPEGTEAVCTVNVKHLLHSPLIKNYCLETLKQVVKSAPVQRGIAALGFDPLRDIDRVVAAVAAGAEDGYCLVIVHGRFDTARFQGAAQVMAKEWDEVVKVHQAGSHRFYEIVGSGKHGSLLMGSGLSEDGRVAPALNLNGNGGPWALAESLFVALVDKGTLVVSTSKDGVRGALETAGGKRAALDKDLRRLIEETDGKQSLWLVQKPGEPPAQENDDGETSETAEPAPAVTITGGVAVGDDVKVRVVLSASTLEGAREIMSGLDDLATRAGGLAALLAGKDRKMAPIREIPRAFRASRKGHTVVVEGQLDVDLIDQLAGLLMDDE